MFLNALPMLRPAASSMARLIRKPDDKRSTEHLLPTVVRLSKWIDQFHAGVCKVCCVARYNSHAVFKRSSCNQGITV
jgi:hypothetical protein